MLYLHWLELAFGGVILAIVFYILGALDGVEKEPETYYSPEEDAYWAEFVRVLNKRDGRS